MNSKESGFRQLVAILRKKLSNLFLDKILQFVHNWYVYPNELEKKNPAYFWFPEWWHRCLTCHSCFRSCQRSFLGKLFFLYCLQVSASNIYKFFFSTCFTCPQYFQSFCRSHFYWSMNILWSIVGLVSAWIGLTCKVKIRERVNICRQKFQEIDPIYFGVYTQ